MTMEPTPRSKHSSSDPVPAASLTASTEATRTARKRLRFERFYSRTGVDPFDEVEWELRDAVITNEKGEVVFEQQNVEVPKSLVPAGDERRRPKYFRGQLGTPERETQRPPADRPRGRTTAAWGREGGYFAADEDAETFEDELTHLLVHQMVSFNSPVWFNVGVEEQPQCSACFINSVEDTMESILDWPRPRACSSSSARAPAPTSRTIRSSEELLAGGGTASGPVSFMKGYDAFAGVIKSGGKTRRAAKMVILNVDHPDIVDFINCKAEGGEEGLGADRRRLRRRLQRRGRRLRLGLLPERQPLGAGHRRVHAGRAWTTASGRPGP